MIYLEVIALLKNIKFDKGLTELEILKVKSIMDILPISDGFYNWRDFLDEKILKSKNMNYFFEYIRHASSDEYIPNSDCLVKNGVQCLKIHKKERSYYK